MGVVLAYPTTAYFQWGFLKKDPYTYRLNNNNNNNNNNDVLYCAGIRLKEGAHGAFAENKIDKYS